MAKIKGENIIQSWSAHLPSIGNRRQEFFDFVSRTFESKNTNLNLKSENFGSFFGAKQDYLYIDYGIYWGIYGAEVFGNDLVVSWDLYTKNVKKESSKAQWAVLLWTDYNEIAALRAFASVTSSIAIEAADKLIEGTSISKDKISRRSSGTLGPL